MRKRAKPHTRKAKRKHRHWDTPVYTDTVHHSNAIWLCLLRSGGKGDDTPRHTYTCIVSVVWKLVFKDAQIFKLYSSEPHCQLAWEPRILNLAYHWLKKKQKNRAAGHRASVDRYMTDLCTRKEGRSIQSYWSRGSMKGQRIHNAEATSQHPPIASWCESSALKLVKCELECVCVCVCV